MEVLIFVNCSIFSLQAKSASLQKDQNIHTRMCPRCTSRRIGPLVGPRMMISPPRLLMGTTQVGVACPGRTAVEVAIDPHHQRHITHTLASAHPPHTIAAPHLHNSNLAEGHLGGVLDPNTIPSLPHVRSGTELDHAPL